MSISLKKRRNIKTQNIATKQHGPIKPTELKLGAMATRNTNDQLTFTCQPAFIILNTEHFNAHKDKKDPWENSQINLHHVVVHSAKISNRCHFKEK